MTPTHRESRISRLELLPHQITFLDTFFSPTSKRVVVLRADVGLGKSAALVALASRLLRERPTARALFLVPGALRSQFVERLRNEGTPTLSIDRYQFREMLDSATEGELWPSGVAVVVGREFARQEDIRDALSKVRWDLLIVDEAHQFSGRLAAEVLRRIGESSGRLVLATATLTNLQLPDGIAESSATVVQWRRDQVVGHDGRLLDTLPRPLLHEGPFSLSPAELSLRELVEELARTFETDSPQQRMIARMLRRCLESSLAALEGALQRIVGRSQEGIELLLETSDEGVRLLLETSDEGALDDQSVDRLAVEKSAGIAKRALQKIESIGDDSKLSAFSGLVNRLIEVKAPSRRICVLTDYKGTLYYLAAEIEGLGLTCRLLHGGMSDEDRQGSLTLFSSTGGILVATRAVTEGVNLREVTDLVLYDIPGSELALREVLGQFDRFLRVSQLNVHVLVPSNSADVLISESAGLLRKILNFQTDVQPSGPAPDQPRLAARPPAQLPTTEEEGA